MCEHVGEWVLIVVAGLGHTPGGLLLNICPTVYCLLPFSSPLLSSCSLVLSGILAALTFLWHWGQSMKLQHVRRRRLLLSSVLQRDDPGAALATPLLLAAAPALDSEKGEER